RAARWNDLNELLQNLSDVKADPAKLGWLRARAQAQKKEYRSALRTIDEVIVLDPQAIGPRVLLSHILIQSGGDWEAAERALLDVLDLEPGNQEAQHNLRVLRRNQNRFREAVALGVEA